MSQKKFFKLPSYKNLIRIKNLPKITLILATFILSILLVVTTYIALNNEGIIKDRYFFGSSNILKETSNPNQKVENIFQLEIPQLDGRWAVAVKDLKTQQTYFYKEKEIFTAASLYKLAVMWATYDAIDKNILQKDQLLTPDQITIEDKTSPLSLETATKAMITISDNNSAILLAEKLGWKNIEDLMKKEGISDIDLTSKNSPFISAKSTMDIFERIYQNTAVNSKYSQKMKALLFEQEINDRIPKYIPPETPIAHKTGEIDNFRHDAGIVIGKKSHYIFVFLAENPNTQEVVEEIALLSRKIFDAFEEN